MAEKQKPDPFENRYLSPEFVDLWRNDEGLEPVRRFWRGKLLDFLPFECSAAFRVLDLGAGTGMLTIELLNRYPNASVTCAGFLPSHANPC